MSWIVVVLVCVALVSVLAEARHLRGTIRGRALFFNGVDSVARRGIRMAAVAGLFRVVALAMVTFGALTLPLVEPRRTSGALKVETAGVRRLVILLDVSPSMTLEDAGPTRFARWRQAARQVERVLRQIDVSRTRISLYAMYSGAKPVVVDTYDANVILTLASGAPLGFAFPIGVTDIPGSVRDVFDTVKSYPASSTTLLVITDGDTDSQSNVPPVPASVSRVIIAGVGNARSGSFIDNHLSRQEAMGLRTLANRLGGNYFNVNDADLPPDLLDEISGVLPERRSLSSVGPRELALMAIAAGGLFHSLLTILPAWFDHRLAMAGEAR